MVNERLMSLIMTEHPAWCRRLSREAALSARLSASAGITPPCLLFPSRLASPMLAL